MATGTADEFTAILLKLKPEFVQEIDDAVKASGAASRMQFIRDAIAEKIASMNIALAADLAAPRSRLGKGGRPTHLKHRIKADAQHPPAKANAVLPGRTTISSKQLAVVKSVSASMAASLPGQVPGEPSTATGAPNETTAPPSRRTAKESSRPRRTQALAPSESASSPDSQS